MTHTTTDAAEARATDYTEMAAARMRSIAAIPDAVIDAALNAIVPGGARVAAWLPDRVERDVIRHALHAAFATAEAASGAGERGAIAYLHKHPDHFDVLDKMPLADGDKAVGWTETPLYASLPPATAPAMVTVPREPTEAMWEAFDIYNGDKRTSYDTWLKAWSAMLAATPTTPATGEQGA